jgi:SAM-dependent methyltransferase
VVVLRHFTASELTATWGPVDIVLLWTAIAATTIAFWRRSLVAGLLFVPPLAWVGFAAVLNFAIWWRNRQGAGISSRRQASSFWPTGLPVGPEVCLNATLPKGIAMLCRNNTACILKTESSHMNANAEEALLSQINQFLPKDVDWKSGARRYLKDLVHRGGESYLRWHYTKPFIAEPLSGSALHDDESQSGVDKYVLWNELYPVLNILRKVDLPPNSRVLDVACGPGWISHFIGKMGHRVLGVDISEEMIDIAKERVKAEPYPPFPLEKLNVDFLVHDLEESPLPTSDQFDFVLIDSALHHFYSPIQTVRNIATHIAPGGVLAIIEGIAPTSAPPGAIEMAIMRKYHTLERPYTRQQMQQILSFAGFPEAIFFDSVNGLIETSRDIVATLPTISSRGMNHVITAKERETLARLAPHLDSSQKHIEWIGFHGEERPKTGTPFRWSPAESRLEISGYESLSLEIESIYPSLTQQKQTIEVHHDGKLIVRFEFTPGHKKDRIDLKGLTGPSKLEFFADAVVYPFIHKINDDRRQLAFMLKLSSEQ